MKAVWLAAALAAAAAIVIGLHDVLLVFFAAAVFAVPLRAAARAVARPFGAPTGAGLAVVLAAALLITAAIVWLWEALLAVQVRQLVAALPGAFATVLAAANAEGWLARVPAGFPDLGSVLSGAGGMIGAIRRIAGGTLAAAVDVAIIAFAAVCFAAEPQTYVRGALRLVTPARRSRVAAVLDECADTVLLWLRARAISMCVLGSLVWAGLSLLGMPDSGALALLAAVFAFVPNVGAIAAAGPSLLLAAAFGWHRVVIVAALYWLAHTVDDFLVIPVAERRVVRLPPALTIAAQLVLGLAGGVLGIMLAAPLTAVTIVAIRRLVVEDVIERKSVAQPPSLALRS